MTKHIWKLVLLILLAFIVFVWLIKAPIMSSYLSDKMKVPVSVGTISMWPSKTTIHRFKIMNPRGFKEKTAFQVDHAEIDYKYKHLFSDPTELDQITLDKVYLSIELRNATGTDNNWSEIGARMPKEKSNREVIIHSLTLNNITVDVGGPGAKILGVAGIRHFDRMQFNEIDSREGFPTKELVRKIFEGAGIQQYLQNFLNPAKQIQNALKPFNLFGSAEENSPPVQGL